MHYPVRSMVTETNVRRTATRVGRLTVVQCSGGSKGKEGREGREGGKGRDLKGKEGRKRQMGREGKGREGKGRDERLVVVVRLSHPPAGQRQK